MRKATAQELIGDLIAGGHLKTPAIIGAFHKIDRADFVPPEFIEEAYGNYPLAIGFGQTISQPLTVAFMLELLEPGPGENILEVGSGSGWQTALLAELIGKNGRVTAIERIPELERMGETNIEKYGFMKSGIARIILGDGSKGFAANAPYDKIIAAAAASEDVPLAWKGQLRSGGRIVAPVGDSIIAFDKAKDGKFKTRKYEGFSFVPLVED